MLLADGPRSSDDEIRQKVRTPSYYIVYEYRNFPEDRTVRSALPPWETLMPPPTRQEIVIFVPKTQPRNDKTRHNTIYSYNSKKLLATDRGVKLTIYLEKSNEVCGQLFRYHCRYHLGADDTHALW